MQNSRTLTQLRRQRANLKREENRVAAEITEVQSVREEAPPDISESKTSLENHIKQKEGIEAEIAKAEEEAAAVPEKLEPWQEKFNEKKQEIEQLARRSEQIAAYLSTVHKKTTTVLYPLSFTLALVIITQRSHYRSPQRRSKCFIRARS